MSNPAAPWLKSVLIVDDDVSYAAQLSSVLRAHSVHAQHVGSAKVALHVLGTIRFDVIVTDIYMPECDGIELLGRIKDEQPETPVIGMMTDDSELSSVIVRIFRRMGGAAVVHKPVPISGLLKILTSLPGPPH